MLELTIKTLFQGSCALNERYIKLALKEKKGLRITFYKPIFRGSVKEEVMEIKAKDVVARIREKKGPFKDRYGKSVYTLCYFNWLPKIKEVKDESPKQGTLI